MNCSPADQISYRWQASSEKLALTKRRPALNWSGLPDSWSRYWAAVVVGVRQARGCKVVRELELPPFVRGVNPEWWKQCRWTLIFEASGSGWPRNHVKNCSRIEQVKVFLQVMDYLLRSRTNFFPLRSAVAKKTDKIWKIEVINRDVDSNSDLNSVWLAYFRWTRARL